MLILLYKIQIVKNCTSVLVKPTSLLWRSKCTALPITSGVQIIISLSFAEHLPSSRLRLYDFCYQQSDVFRPREQARIRRLYLLPHGDGRSTPAEAAMPADYESQLSARSLRIRQRGLEWHQNGKDFSSCARLTSGIDGKLWFRCAFHVFKTVEIALAPPKKIAFIRKLNALVIKRDISKSPNRISTRK